MSGPAPRLVGVVHLAPLPGSPRESGDLQATVARAAEEARVLEGAGFDAVVVENFGDAPFFPDAVPPVTVAAMTACALAIRAAAPGLVLGVNVLRNDAAAALSIAKVAGAGFVRVNVHTGARVTDQGVVQGRAAETLRLRRALAADDVAIWADVDVKHSHALGAARAEGAEGSVGEEAEDLVHRGLADVVLVTGSGTARPAALARVRAVRDAVSVPVLVASGATEATLPAIAQHAFGVIVGSALREGGRPAVALDRARTESFARAFRAAFAS
jgi:membrane complex biogenesis BtpA family protein